MAATILTLCPRCCTILARKPGINAFLLTQLSTDFKHNKQSPYIITTPIFYVNAAPHLGHLYTSLLADASCRWRSLKGQSVKLVTGTDEHGQKIEQAAHTHGQSPEDYCQKISQKYQGLFTAFDIKHTDFIRTTDPAHIHAVQHFWERISGYLFKDKYQGWYCTSDEAFLTESQIEESDNKMVVSKESGQICEPIEEENYMFPLHLFADDIRRWHATNVIRPSGFLSSLDGALENITDLSVSRSSQRLSWGIPVPNDPSQTIYVWLDALVNYLTACGYPRNLTNWPVSCHIVGKDILRFHAIYWPAFLMAADLPLPRSILCHSHWLVDDRKMSKSIGNVVDPMQLRGRYTSDGLRYFLLREGVAGQDGNYSESKMLNYLNSELCNTLGNLLNRCTSKSINKQQTYPPLDLDVHERVEEDGWKELMADLDLLPGLVSQHYEEYNFYKAVDCIMLQLRKSNGFMESQRPWELKDNPVLLDTVLHIVMENLRVCGILLQPIIPNLSCTLLDRLGIPKGARQVEDLLPLSCHREARMLQEGSPLYQRIKKDVHHTNT
ncbi:methionine--tRNA ligase, mitochondrial-like [Watersipora subatra]|uniref:methionine--tRNA ligase, mitochondrial-like n=1 Tax=Watersipora subatra TaxID=2589382 RepID=UPI00355B6A84